jgi:hypothetical protein
MALSPGDRVSEILSYPHRLGDAPRYAEGVVTRVAHPIHTPLAKVLWDDADLRGSDPDGTWRPVSKLNYLGRDPNAPAVEEKPSHRSFEAR